MLTTSDTASYLNPIGEREYVSKNEQREIEKMINEENKKEQREKEDRLILEQLEKEEHDLKEHKSDSIYKYIASELTEEERYFKFVELLQSTNRPNINTLIAHTMTLGIITAPGSMKHHTFKGGLLVHSLELFSVAYLYREYKIKQGWKEEDIPMDSLIISALLHDLCKADQLIYDCNKCCPIRVKYEKGHGSISVERIKECGFELKEIEEYAIKYHMNSWKQNHEEHYEQYPLSDVIYRSDHLSTNHSPLNCKKTLMQQKHYQETGLSFQEKKYVQKTTKLDLNDILYSNENNTIDQFISVLTNNDNVFIEIEIDDYHLGIYIDKRIQKVNEFVESKTIKYFDLKNQKVFSIKDGMYNEEYTNSELSFYLASDQHNDYILQLGVGDLIVTRDLYATAEPNVYESDIEFSNRIVNRLVIYGLSSSKSDSTSSNSYSDDGCIKRREDENNNEEMKKDIEYLQKEINELTSLLPSIEEINKEIKEKDKRIKSLESIIEKLNQSKDN